MANYTVVGTTLVVTGDVSAGVAVGPAYTYTGPYSGLTVENVTTGINSAAEGIIFDGTGNTYDPILLDTDLTNGVGGPFTIIAATTGILATGTSAFELAHTGDIEAGAGIKVETEGAVTISSAANIDTTATDGIAIRGYAKFDDVEIESTGDLTTIGSSANGIDGQAGYYGVTGPVSGVTIRHTGDISTTGQSGDAVRAISYLGGDVIIETEGLIQVEGSGADAVVAVANGGGSVEINHTGNVTAPEGSVGRIRGFTEDGDIELSIKGDVVVGGNFDDAIDLRSGSGTINADIEGDITVTGPGSAVDILGFSGANAISLKVTGDIATSSNPYGYDAVRVRSLDSAPIDVELLGDINTLGKGADALETYSGYGNITIRHTGDITVVGDDEASGIVATSARYGVDPYDPYAPLVTDTGDFHITNTGKIESETGSGIQAESFLNGDVSVYQTGDVTVRGDNNDAIFAKARGTGNVVVEFSGGTVRAVGLEDNDGIDVRSIYGDATVRVTGDVEADEDAVEVSGNRVNVDVTGNLKSVETGRNYGGGISTLGDEITIHHLGTIDTYGTASDGISAKTVGFLGVPGSINIVHQGNIATRDFASAGIRAFSDYGQDIDITHTGDIATSGGNDPNSVPLDSSGITAISNNGDGGVVIRRSEGTISTKADSSDGIRAYSDIGYARVESEGAIITEGEDSHGIIAISRTPDIFFIPPWRPQWPDTLTGGGDVFVQHTGDITTAGTKAEAIYAYSPGGGNIKVYAEGDLTTTGADADGIFAETTGGDVDVNHTGDIATETDGADGVLALANAAGNSAGIYHRGSITTKGSNAEALYARTVDGQIDIIANFGGHIGGRFNRRPGQYLGRKRLRSHGEQEYRSRPGRPRYSGRVVLRTSTSSAR